MANLLTHIGMLLLGIGSSGALASDLSMSEFLSEGNSRASQMTVTPTSTFTVRAIKATFFSSNDGSCTSKMSDFTIDKGVGQTKTLTSAHDYHTTDASIFALGAATAFDFNPVRDASFQLLDNALAPLGSEGCIQAGGACGSDSDCGWSSARLWTP